MPIRERFVVEGLAGRKTLKGEVAVSGAKNAVLKALAASILFEDEVAIENAPEIEDAERMKELLRAAGATVKGEGKRVVVAPPSGWKSELEKSIAERLRSSIVLTGPLLARTGEARFPFPGGCVLGERPIDLFISGFEKMGVVVREEEGEFFLRSKEGCLCGAEIFFPFVSVTATETLMLAAALAKGETILRNAALEPEIPALADYLNECGAHIRGAGTDTIYIRGTGGVPLRAEGRVFATPPDRIEAGSFAILAALAGEDIRITSCEPAHVAALLSVLERAGVSLSVEEDAIQVAGGAVRNDALQSMSIRTHEYPGFPTDLGAPMAVFLSQSSGEATLLETIFDGRFRYAEDLVRMGADMTVMNPHRLLIRGPRPLSSAELESPDLRAGLAYLIAASIASGTSYIDNAYLIDRGYEHIEARLGALGLSIRRELVR